MYFYPLLFTQRTHWSGRAMWKMHKHSNDVFAPRGCFTVHTNRLFWSISPPSPSPSPSVPFIAVHLILAVQFIPKSRPGEWLFFFIQFSHSDNGGGWVHRHICGTASTGAVNTFQGYNPRHGFYGVSGQWHAVIPTVHSKGIKDLTVSP